MNHRVAIALEFDRFFHCNSFTYHKIEEKIMHEFNCYGFPDELLLCTAGSVK